MDEYDLGAIARGIIDEVQYMTLGTADASGHPWVSPVWFAADGYRVFYWVSDPKTQHSRNLAIRPELSIVIFDSRAAIGTGQAVYIAAVAEQVSGGEIERGIEIFSRRSVAMGGPEWTADDVAAGGRLQLYRAIAREQWILDPRNDRPGDNRITVALD